MSEAVRALRARQANYVRSGMSFDGVPDTTQRPFEESADRPMPEHQKSDPASLWPIYQLMIFRHSIGPMCESPIEADLAIAVLRRALETGIPAAVGEYRHAKSFSRGVKLLILAQAPLERFRYDFYMRHGAQRCLVECDGKDFHSSPEQIANDRQKDLAAKAAGVPMLRFSGSELWRQPQACALSVIKLLQLPERAPVQNNAPAGAGA